ncbi:PspA/IM30 family protein [Leptolyngbya iicbica]|uniref:PspA/IM30 family protein n=2 Tax=Cyanophyceae TaxID=3028117 RepID=A0A4Q7E9T6_9CYAN|nr:PspA/IM30 family protein [Leptolyngbya sp. LK]RZM79199.1 PspA/IM30 family protein [Leptolyngbya sp. LK]
MGVLGRLGQVIRSQVGDWVNGAEDPEKMLDQAVADMQRDLIQLRQAVAQAIATQKRTERQQHQNQTLAQEWYNRAQLALQKGQEDQARDALTQRHAYQRLGTQLANHISEQKVAIAQLKTNMRDLEVKIADVRTRRDMYIARARSAEASQRIQDLIGQVGHERSLGTLSQMEDKVLDLEAQASATAELNQALTDQSLEGQFAALERDEATAIEQELSTLKNRLPHQSG